MGVGLSFLSGFLQGTVDAQKEKRQAELLQQQKDEERRDKLGTLVFELIKDNKLSGEKGAALLRQDDLSMADLAEATNIMDSIESTIAYGSFNMQKPEKWDEDIRPDNQLRAGGTWLRTMDLMSRNADQRAEFIAEMQRNPAALENFRSDMLRYSGYYITGQQKENTNPATGVVSGYMKPSAAYSTLHGLMAEIDTPVDDDSDAVTISMNKDIDTPGNAVVFKFRSEDGTEMMEARQFDAGVYTSLEKIAINLNYKGNGNTTPVQQLVNNFPDVYRANNADEAFAVLLSAAELERVGADAFNRTGGANNELAARVAITLKERFGDDRISMAQAMAPLMVLTEDQFQKDSRYAYSMQPAAHYFKKYLAVDVAQVREQYTETQDTLQLLNELNDIVAKKTTPTGFVASATRVIGGVFGPGGQVDQLLGNNTDQVSGQAVLDRANEMGYISTSVVKDLSQIDALKLTLAAKMARAVDPSGRLSNQDFEVQLQRLGQAGLMTGRVEALSKLDIVIQDFQNRSSRMQLLNELANAPEFGAREARLLKANMAVQKSLDADRMNLYSGAAQGGGAGASAGDVDGDGIPETLTLDSDMGFYTDKKGNYFKDEQGQSPVSTEEFNAKFNEVYS